MNEKFEKLYNLMNDETVSKDIKEIIYENVENLKDVWKSVVDGHEYTSKKIDNIESSILKDLNNAVIELNNKIDALEEKINDRIELLENDIDAQLDDIDNRIDEVEDKISELKSANDMQVDNLQELINDVDDDLRKFKGEVDTQIISTIINYNTTKSGDLDNRINR